MHVVPRPPRLRARFVLIATLVACAAALRLVPHPPNFTPVGEPRPMSTVGGSVSA